MTFLRYLPVLGVCFVLLPVLSGVLVSLLPAFGFFPGLNSYQIDFTAWQDFFNQAAIWKSVIVSFGVGLSATVISLLLTIIVGAWRPFENLFQRFQPILSPILSIPHLSFALGFLFLWQPSGWVMRMVQAVFGGAERPLDYIFPSDEIGLILVLVLKEFPFLLLMSYIAQSQIPKLRLLSVSQSLGYSASRAWLFVIFPMIYRQMRIAVYIVLIFALSVVDIPQIVGPSLPSPLSVRILQWYMSADLSQQYLAAVGVVAQLCLVLITCGLWYLTERIIGFLCQPTPNKSDVSRKWVSVLRDHFIKKSVGLIIFAIGGMAVLAIMAMGIWSFAQFWRYPDLFPAQLTLRHWGGMTDNLLNPLSHSLFIGGIVTGASLLFCLLFLERKTQFPEKGNRLWVLDMILFSPLFLPQISFLFGLQTVFSFLGIEPGIGGVIWMHCLFVIPYIYLSLKGPYLAWDRRYEYCALSLGKSFLQMWFYIKFPMLKRAIFLSAAIGFSVSNALFLPTIFGGGGRVSTLVTEIIIFANGADWRLSAIAALILMALPWGGYGLAALFSTKSVKL